MSTSTTEKTGLSVGEIRSRLREAGLTVDAPISPELSHTLVTRFRWIASALSLPVSQDFSNIIEDDGQENNNE